MSLVVRETHPSTSLVSVDAFLLLPKHLAGLYVFTGVRSSLCHICVLQIYSRFF